ncbi:response regulator transcription factor [Flectobacillus major]|jgi:DNA-binding CsgD family transcriptional regulator|uniref:response regulator transcription factor n=1 Tax=Flectobacillus major TaxID=103 RepID=UPI0005C599E1|nr:LuxR C-terminal-related transcriptional regulator [Flectobacillus major]
MSNVFTNTFDFKVFKQIWKSEDLSSDKKMLETLTKDNPLLHDTLLMQGIAMAVIDTTTLQYALILGDVDKVCGWSADYLYKVGMEGFVNQFLPQDKLGLIEISKKINSYLLSLENQQLRSFRAIYDYRIERKNGATTRICQENLILKVNEEKQAIYTLAYISDITHFKKDGKQHLLLSGGNTDILLEIDNNLSTCQKLPLLTKRELEIAKLLGQGRLSEHIAQDLFISVNTVNKHRQNMLRKLGLADTLELINFLKIYRLI